MIEPTSLLLGLEGLGVRAVGRQADGTRVVEVITTDPNASRCPDCGISSTSVKGYAVTTPRDIRYGDDPIRLRWPAQWSRSPTIRGCPGRPPPPPSSTMPMPSWARWRR